MREGEYKCRVCKMYLKLRDQQLKTSTYIDSYTKISQLLQKIPSVIDIHTQKKKMESKHDTKDSNQISREESKRRKGNKRPIKTNPKQ